MEHATDGFCMTTPDTGQDLCWGGEVAITLISVIILTNAFALADFYSILSRYFH